MNQTRRAFLKSSAAAAAVGYLGGPGALLAATDANPLVVRGKPLFKFRTVSVSRLPELKQTLQKTLNGEGISRDEIFLSYVKKLTCTPPKEMPDAQSFIIVALPIKIAELFFRWKGERHKVIIPPGYVSPVIDGEPVDRKELISYLKREVLRDEKAELFSGEAMPMKLAAAYAGLATYGRNNISYVPGMGSFHYLFAFFTRKTLKDTWARPKMLRDCKGCEICIDACPTKCISKNRFPIDVTKCVTLYNERPEPMPHWMPKQAHCALVGCTKCQFTCPANKNRLGYVEQFEEISEAETALLLSGKADEQLEKSIRKKLARIDLVNDLKHLGRNLRLLL